MSLSIGGFYTNTYESCNTNSYSTPDDFELVDVLPGLKAEDSYS